jgi:hypothetical protein
MARELADIIEEICNHLRPWKRREADVRSEVEKRIALPTKIAAEIDKWPRGADVRRQAAEAQKTLAQLQDQLAREPLRSYPALMFRQQFIDLDLLDETLTNTKRAKFPDPRSKPMQWVCAEAADALIHELSTKPATGTPDSALHAIASLLYEAITGQPDQDLKRAVDGMIKSWRGLDCMPGRGRPGRGRPGRGGAKG